MAIFVNFLLNEFLAVKLVTVFIEFVVIFFEMPSHLIVISIMRVLLEKRALGLAHNVDVDVARGRIDWLSIYRDVNAAHILGLLTHDEAHLLA